MIKMKALRSFGVANANEGHVSRGREFSAASEQRARDLEDAGLAYRIEPSFVPPTHKMQPSPVNMASAAGPLDSPGGTTGEVPPAPSSPPDPPRRRRKSTRSKEGADLLSSQ